MRLLLFCLSLCLLTACYEDRSGCLDPAASNYDLLADEPCADCCTFPELSVRVATVWNDSALVVGRTYTDGAGNEFQFVRFRYYLGDLRLEAEGVELSDPLRPVDLRQRVAGDSSVTLSGNYLLASIPTTTTTIGTLGDYAGALSGISGTYGLDNRYRNIIPSSAPTGDALRTQAGLLNFNDGRGYVQAKLEYTLGPDTDTTVISTYGSLPFDLAFRFASEIVPREGFDIRVDIEARLDRLIGNVNLTDTAAVANALSRRPEFLDVTGLEL